MNLDVEQLKKEYKAFFEESDAGRYFTDQLSSLIDFNHQSAELKPENARDHTQRAKGNREVLAHIQIVINGVKKGEAKASRQSRG